MPGLADSARRGNYVRLFVVCWRVQQGIETLLSIIKGLLRIVRMVRTPGAALGPRRGYEAAACAEPGLPCATVILSTLAVLHGKTRCRFSSVPALGGRAGHRALCLLVLYFGVIGTPRVYAVHVRLNLSLPPPGYWNALPVLISAS